MRSLPANRLCTLLLGLLVLGCAPGRSQTLPATAGETLSGQRLALAQAVQGHATILIAGFSKEAGDSCGAWARAIHADPALAATLVYQIASLEQAPGFVRGMIKSSMRKGMSPQDQDHFVILTQDETLWRAYFSVANDKDPYVVYLDPSGKILWHGHGDAITLEPLLSKSKP